MQDALKDTSNQADIALVRSQASGSALFATAVGVSLPGLTAPELVVIAGLIVGRPGQTNITLLLTLQLTDSAADTVEITFSAIPNATSVSGGVLVGDGIYVENGGAPVVVNGGTPTVIQTFSKALPAGGLTDIITIHLSLPIPDDAGFSIALSATHNLSAMMMNLTVAG